MLAHRFRTAVALVLGLAALPCAAFAQSTGAGDRGPSPTKGTSASGAQAGNPSTYGGSTAKRGSHAGKATTSKHHARSKHGSTAGRTRAAATPTPR